MSCCACKSSGIRPYALLNGLPAGMQTSRITRGAFLYQRQPKTCLYAKQARTSPCIHAPRLNSTNNNLLPTGLSCPCDCLSRGGAARSLLTGLSSAEPETSRPSSILGNSLAFVNLRSHPLIYSSLQIGCEECLGDRCRTRSSRPPTHRNHGRRRATQLRNSCARAGYPPQGSSLEQPSMAIGALG